ncbi:MAG TPA: hypothetical protein VMR28_01035 [Candidatus Saccharimonadales bacterium]|nr:hypothetical protein [Candidatus Saccharimonadales bacterium]
MVNTYWHKQSPDKPLFAELMWSRPENKRHAGKLLIIGGNSHGFSTAAETYRESLKSGIGTVRVLLPDALQKIVSKIFIEAEFAPSTPSGSFSQRSVAEVLSLADWADSILLASDIGHNSETAIMIETIVRKYHGQLTLFGDSIDYLKQSSSNLFERASTTFCPTFQQLQQLVVSSHAVQPITSGMDLLHFVDALHELTEHSSANFIIDHLENICATSGGQVCTTRINQRPTTSSLAARASVWLTQNPTKPFEALACSAYQLVESMSSETTI